MLAEWGLAAALPEYLRDWSEHYNVVAEYRSTFEPGQLSADAEVAFCRVAQEALNNVVRHAKGESRRRHARRARWQRDAAGRDDGAGFDVANEAMTTGRFGVVGMRERAALIGATLDIESTPGAGTSVFLRRPIGP